MKFLFNIFRVNSRKSVNDGALIFPNMENKTLLSDIYNKDFEDITFLSASAMGMKVYQPEPQTYTERNKEFFSRLINLRKKGEIEYAIVEFQFSNYAKSDKERTFILCYLYLNYYKKMEQLLKINFDLKGKLSFEIEEAKKKYNEQKNDHDAEFDLLSIVEKRKHEWSFNELLNTITSVEDNISFNLCMLDNIESYLNITNKEEVKYTTINFTLNDEKALIKNIGTNHYSKNNIYIFHHDKEKFQIERDINSKDTDFDNVYIRIFKGVIFEYDNIDVKRVFIGFKDKADTFFVEALENKLKHLGIGVSYEARRDFSFGDIKFQTKDKKTNQEVYQALRSNNNLNAIEKSMALQILDIESIKNKYYQFMLSEGKSFDTISKSDIQTLCMFYPEAEELFNYLSNQLNIIVDASSTIKGDFSAEKMVACLDLLK